MNLSRQSEEEEKVLPYIKRYKPLPFVSRLQKDSMIE